MSKTVTSRIKCNMVIIISFFLLGLFKQAIMQSGSPLCQWAYHTHAKAFENARDLAGRLGYNGLSTVGLLNFLRVAPARSVVEKAQQVDLVITRNCLQIYVQYFERLD